MLKINDIVVEKLIFCIKLYKSEETNIILILSFVLHQHLSMIDAMNNAMEAVRFKLSRHPTI